MEYGSSRKEEIKCNEDEVSEEYVWSNACKKWDAMDN